MAKGDNIVVRCARCERHVTGVQYGHYHRRSEAENWELDEITLLACPECRLPFVVRRYGDVMDTDQYGNPNEYRWDDEHVPIYPNDPETMDPSVPVKIATSYLEARRIFTNASAYTAAAIMCRRTLEGICKDFEAKGNTLKARLLDLKNAGRIETRLFEWADAVLRALGNDAAHDVDTTISKQDAQDALEFTRAIVEYLYVFEAAFKRFKERRENAPPASPPENLEPEAN